MLAASAEAGGTSLRGRLARRQDKVPALRGPDGRLITLEGDPDTTAVLGDDRLAGLDFEVEGQVLAADRFRVGPFHTRSIWVHRDGSKLAVSYWCEVCSIRTYTPGLCMCCRDETALELREYPPK